MLQFDAFMNYLKTDKNASENTLTAYGRDIRAFDKYMAEKGSSIEKANKTDVVSYIMDINKAGRSKATSNRKLASLRAYYGYLIRGGVVKEDPTTDIRTSRADRRELEFLSLAEVETLLDLPDDSIKGIRDKAILEILYGTGIMVMELIELNYSDLNLRMGFITCSGAHGKPRIVPIGSYAKQALARYVQESRPALMHRNGNRDAGNSPLFVNYTGERFTRQGLWKVLTRYADAAGLQGRLTPHILRTSFAVHMIQNGADLKTLQELMGYDDMQAMQVYLQVSKSRIKDVYDKTHPRA